MSMCTWGKLTHVQVLKDLREDPDVIPRPCLLAEPGLPRCSLLLSFLLLPLPLKPLLYLRGRTLELQATRLNPCPLFRAINVDA